MIIWSLYPKIVCDKCKVVTETSHTTHFLRFVAHIKQLGWHIEPKGHNKWEHSCPACEKKYQRLWLMHKIAKRKGIHRNKKPYVPQPGDADYIPDR